MNRRAYIGQFHHFQFNREQHFAPKIYTALKDQYQQFILNYRGGEGHRAFDNISYEGVHAVLKAIYRDSIHYASLIHSQLPKAPKKVKRRAVIGFNEEMIQLINAYYGGDILNFSQGITDTTKDQIKAVLQEATVNGYALDWIVNKLNESTDLNRSRSRLIARTETVTATNQAGYFAAASTGLLMQKEWLSTLDQRTRLEHQLVNGSIVGFDDYFNVSGVTMLVPGARVQQNGLPTPPETVCNCRCVCLHIPQRVNGRLVEHDYGMNLVSA